MESNMYLEIVASVLASLGGASFIVGVFAHYLGKIWTDRIAKSTSARFTNELEILKSNNVHALEEFKSKSLLALKERESFAGISQEFYQDFFKKRVNTYQKLLNQKNQYITKMEEEFLTDELENWGIVYHSAYTSIRKLIIENQLYISNELDKLFNELRKSASEYIKEADLVEANNYSQNNPSWEDETLNAVYDKFAKNTLSMMNAVLEQITLDVSKLRSRIEID
jgi:hypothetical protein